MADLLLEHAGIQYALHPDVYEPAEDTYLLLESVSRLPPGRLLEIGTGCGLVAIAAARSGHRVVATDLNEQALHLARTNAQRNGVHLDLVRGNLLQGLRWRVFDTVAFNPPYLPTHPSDRVPGALNHAFDGGPTGRSVLESFLRQAQPASPPVLLVVASSLQGLDTIRARVRAHGWRMSTVAEQALVMERLYVLRLEFPEG